MAAVKFVTGTLGIITAMIAAPILIAALAVFSAADGDIVELPVIHTSTDARAMTFDADDFDYWGVRISADPGDSVTVSITGDDLFVGVGPRADVNRLVAGDADPLSAPIWLASASGDNPEIEVELADGPWRAVIMNLDGSPGVDADLLVSLPSTPIRIAAGVAMGAGLMTAILSATLLTVAFRRPRSALTLNRSELERV